jgi:hypothetical protein
LRAIARSARYANAQHLTVLQKLVAVGELSWFPGFQCIDDIMVVFNEGICESDSEEADSYAE